MGISLLVIANEDQSIMRRFIRKYNKKQKDLVRRSASREYEFRGINQRVSSNTNCIVQSVQAIGKKYT